jgi:hypothetical protein
MELDDMKQAWQQMGARIDALEKDQARLRLDIHKQEAARPLRGTSAMLWCELLCNGVLLVLLGIFIARQDQWRFIVPGLLVFVATLALFASNLAQRMAYSALDYGAGVVAIQARLERLCMLRWRSAQMVWLFALLLWVPLMIVIARGLWGGDLYATVSAAWLATNVAVGVVAIPLGWWLARRFAPVLRGTAPGRWFVDSTVGFGLAAARRRLAELADFAAEPA